MQHPIYLAIQERLTDPTRVAKLAKIAATAHKCPEAEGEMICIAEVQMYLQRLAVVDLDKHKLTEDRGVNIFLEVLQEGMSFAPGANHVYILPSFQNPGILAYQVTTDGFVYQAQRAGAIDHITKPVIVYQGDTFQVGTNADGRQVVLHSAQMHNTQKPPVIGGYVFIVYPNGDREPYWMDGADIERLRSKSKRPTQYTSFNGGIDPGFLSSKLIRHGLKNVRKKPLYLSNATEEDEEILPEVAQDAQFAPTMVVEPVAPAPAYQWPQPAQAPAPQAYVAPVPVPPGTTILPGQSWPPVQQPATLNQVAEPF